MADRVPSLDELRRRADLLAARIARERAATRPVGAPVRSSWYRAWRLPVTVRKFERVFAVQGEPWWWRWPRAAQMAWQTVTRKGSTT